MATPAAVAWGMLGSVGVLLATSVPAPVVLVRHGSEVELPSVLLLPLVALVALPDVHRLLTGRLHRRRPTFTARELAYRGYRDAVAVPWSSVLRARVTHGRDTRVVVELDARARRRR